MKHVITSLAFVAISLGAISCEAENLSETNVLYEQGTDGDVVIIDKRTRDTDGTDGDVVIIDKRTKDEDGGN